MSTGPNTPNLGLHNWAGSDDVLRSEWNNNFTAIDTWAGTVKGSGIPYVTDSSAQANAITVTMNPAPTSYTDGMAVCVKVANTTTGSATLNVNNLGAVTIKNSDGTPVGSGDLVSGVPVTFRYASGTSPAFIASGSGGLSGAGNAVAANVLSGKTFTSSSGRNQTGSIPIVSGGNTITPSTSSQSAIASGTYATSAITVAGDANLIAANILSGKSIFGVTGTVIAGKRQASGSTMSDSSLGQITVTGLTFQPSLIVWSESNSNQLMWYNGDGIWTSNYPSQFTRSNGSTNTSIATNTDSGYVNSTGFSLNTNVLSRIFYWWAYE